LRGLADGTVFPICVDIEFVGTALTLALSPPGRGKIKNLGMASPLVARRYYPEPVGVLVHPSLKKKSEGCGRRLPRAIRVDLAIDPKALSSASRAMS
jgi:hypothetical protein